MTGLLILGLCLASTGCVVDPGPIDPTLLNQYQKAVVRRNEAQALRTADQLNPIDATIGQGYGAVTDPVTNVTTIKLSLEDAVQRALANNLDIRVVSYDPEISRQEMIRAAAVFDAVVFGGATYGIQDERANTIFDASSEADSRAVQVGVRKHTTTGADLEARYSLTRLWTSSRFVTNPTTYEPNFTLQATQPLLRGAGRTVNLAALRVARINRKTSEQAFRQRVESVVADTVSAYWALRLARREVGIQERLLVKTKDVHEEVVRRLKIDATVVNLGQTRASVARRKAMLIRARKAVDDIEDALIQLMLGVQGEFAGEIVIEPMTEAGDPIVIDGQGQLITALAHSSQLAQARLAIQAAGINVRVAENGLLPSLGVNASATWMGLSRRPNPANDQMINSKYFSYNLGLLFEYPLGNRSARASLRRAKYERLQAMTNLRNIAVQVARAVKERVRETGRAEAELQAAREAVAANTLQLNGLLSLKGKLPKGRPTPEFLNLILQAIEALGTSERDVEQSLVDYNTALVQLAQVTGTVLKQYGVSLIDDDPADPDDE